MIREKPVEVKDIKGLLDAIKPFKKKVKKKKSKLVKLKTVE